MDAACEFEKRPPQRGYTRRKMPTTPSRDLVTVPNPHADRDYEVQMVCPEFTCVCPMTGQPDFATFTITYVPGPRLVELKSLKLYLWSYREEGAFHEDVTNRVLDDLVHATQARRMEIVSRWLVRGGIETTVRVAHPSLPLVLPENGRAHHAEPV